jgi:hypothetical protein
MENTLDLLLDELLVTYTDALGVSFHSMELPIAKAKGTKTEILEKYKDIPMLSIDESFPTTFSFIITDSGSIVIFFINQLHFVSVYTATTDPNKEFASRIYEQFNNRFEQALKSVQ